RPVSRRTFAKVAAGVAVVGFHGGLGTWATAVAGGGGGDAGRRGGPTSPFARLPRLDGSLELDAASCAAAGQDFGQIIFEQPAAVLRPGSARDISTMLRFARRHGIRVVGRGAGHTVFGQSQHPAAISFDLTSLAAIGPIRGDRVTVQAGCRWNVLLPATLAEGLMPPVLPDYIGQTVGGTLSVGGIGAMSFRNGAQVDHVLELLAVTGDGRRVHCSMDRNRELFEMLLAGQGQVGVIVEATLRLVPAPTTVRLYDLVYPDLSHLLADITTLMEDERFDQMESFVIPTGGGAWFYLLEVIAFHGEGGPPDDATLLEGLAHDPERSASDDLDLLAWSSRVPTNLPSRPNPWCDLLVPMSGAETFLAEVQATIAPTVDGDAFQLLLIPLRSSRFTRPLFRTADEELMIGFDPLRSLPPGSDTEPVLAYNRGLYDRCKQLGGSQYPISAIRLDAQDWAVHYGEQWPRLLEAKRRFDANNTLASGPDVLGLR
ncbi:MAG: FAD-binding protein, partial [Ilumatobacteraceae bacterium]